MFMLCDFCKQFLNAMPLFLIKELIWDTVAKLASLVSKELTRRTIEHANLTNASLHLHMNNSASDKLQQNVFPSARQTLEPCMFAFPRQRWDLPKM